jgi:antitoxin VapB
MTSHARVFRSGNSQAVRLPKEVAYPPHVRDLIVRRDGDRLILEPAPMRSFSSTFWSVIGSVPDFERPPQVPQKRGPLFPW